MSEPLLLALDLGTTNCKAVVYDPAGNEVGRQQTSYPTHTPRGGGFEQRPDDWLRAVNVVLSQTAARLGEQKARLAGIALSAWGPGLVLATADGEPLNDASPTWQDARAAPYGERLIAEAGLDWIGGGIPTTGFPAKLAWARDVWPEHSARAAWALGVKEVVLHHLTGAFATEPSSGPYAETWPVAVIEAAGWSIERLPPVLAPTDVGGRLLPERARALGLPEGLPIVMGLNDGASATIGVGCHRPGDGVVSLSTNGVLRVLVDRQPDARTCFGNAMFRYPLVDGLWVTGGFALSGAESLRWVVNALHAGSDPDRFERVLDEAAACVPGADDLVFLPYLAGRGTPRPDPDAAAAFVGLRPIHERRHMARAVLEGVAFALREIADSLEANGWTIDRVILTGGGARSPLWREIVAGVLEREASHAEGDSTLGAAIVLAVALGIHPSYDDAVVSMTKTRPVPLPERDLDAYRAARERYREASTRLFG